MTYVIVLSKLPNEDVFGSGIKALQRPGVLTKEREWEEDCHNFKKALEITYSLFR